MKRTDLLFMFIVLSLVGIAYNEVKRRYLDSDNDHYKIVKKYFLLWLYIVNKFKLIIIY